MTLAQIESAISYLPNRDLAALMRWLGEFMAAQLDADDWDRKIVADSESGKLEAFFNDAASQVSSGQITAL